MAMDILGEDFAAWKNVPSDVDDLARDGLWMSEATEASGAGARTMAICRTGLSAGKRLASPTQGPPQARLRAFRRWETKIR